jgi:hypothetical protein
VPVIYNVLHNDETKQYKSKNTQFLDDRNLLTSGFNLAIGRTFSNRFAMYLQASVLNYKIDIGNFYPQANPAYNDINKSTYFSGKSYGIMPILEFASRDGIVPVGLTHQIGIGFYAHQVIDKDYLALIRTQFDYEFIEEDLLFNYKDYRVRSQSFMYKLNLRLPINRSLMWNIGFRYNLNFTQGELNFASTSEDYVFSARDYRNFVKRTQASNIVSLETGLSIVF